MAAENIGINESKLKELEEMIKNIHDHEISDEELQERCWDAACKVYKDSLQCQIEIVYLSIQRKDCYIQNKAGKQFSTPLIERCP